MKTRPSFVQPAPMRQKGVVLVVGLIFLLVLTIIGVTALRTTTLEQRMAGNMQQRTLAFQDAEARIALLLNDLNTSQVSLTTGDSCDQIDSDTNPDSVNPSAISSYHTCPEFIGRSTPGRTTDTAEGTQTSFLHFRIESEATTVGNATITLQQGVYQRGPRSSGIVEE